MTLSLDPVLRLLIRAGLALLFASAAAHKLRDLTAFRASLAAYELVPRTVVRGVSVLIAAGEGIVAGALLLLGSSALPALAAAALLGVYTSAIAINLMRGRRDIDCGCAGPMRRQPLGAGLVVRNLVLFSAAVVSALPADPRAFVWIDVFTVVSGLAASCLLYRAVETLLALAPATLRRAPAG
jgi:hypothetical protein